MVAGFEKPDTGRIYLNGEDITDLPPNRRKVNTIFQNYALFPHLTVWERKVHHYEYNRADGTSALCDEKKFSR